VLLFVAILGSHDFVAVLRLLALAGWGVLGVTAFHALPLWLDALAIAVLLPPGVVRRLGDSLIVRWLGESANTLVPAGQIGGPLLMIRQLVQRGVPRPAAVAAITASTTLQGLAQILFGLVGAALLAGRAASVPGARVWGVLLIGAVVIVPTVSFYLLQRRGLFSGVTQLLQRLARSRDWSRLAHHAQEIDQALDTAYARRGAVGRSFLYSFIGWLVGTGEVWLALRLLGSPVDWRHALLLESLGQAIRSAGFAIPASLGVQEGGYLLLAPLAGLTPDVALGLSLFKRCRELLLAVPGLIFLHFCERAFRRRAPAEALSE
jgi:putative membrane protein